MQPVYRCVKSLLVVCEVLEHLDPIVEGHHPGSIRGDERRNKPFGGGLRREDLVVHRGRSVHQQNHRQREPILVEERQFLLDPILVDGKRSAVEPGDKATLGVGDRDREIDDLDRRGEGQRGLGLGLGEGQSCAHAKKGGGKKKAATKSKGQGEEVSFLGADNLTFTAGRATWSAIRDRRPPPV